MNVNLERHFASITYNGDLLIPISPDMDPKEAMARLQEFNRRDLTQVSLDNHNNHLRQAGVEDWQTWTFYSLPSYSESMEETRAFLRKHWPSGIDSLLIPGQWSGGGGMTEAHTKQVDIIGFRGPAKFSPEGHTIYLRLASHV
jgi:hypothetical protein